MLRGDAVGIHPVADETKQAPTLSSMTKKSSLLEQVSVVGSISQPASALETLRRVRPDQADVIELRLDCLQQQAEALREMLPAAAPVLVTARHPLEGGQNQISTAERQALLSGFLGHAAIVDVEVRSFGEMGELTAAATGASSILLASFHDFGGTPELSFLEDLIANAIAHGTDAVKIATHLAGPEDLVTLARLFTLPDRPPLSVMGMGPLGKVSRLLFARLGSILNYGYLDAPTVPAQWEAGELKRMLARL